MKTSIVFYILPWWVDKMKIQLQEELKQILCTMYNKPMQMKSVFYDNGNNHAVELEELFI